jgi:hypothetical protein
MTDTFSVTASWSQSSYTAGQTITATIAGGYVLTAVTTTNSTVGPVVIPLVAADGSRSTVTLPKTTAAVTTTVTTPESVVIDTTVPILDSSPTPRTWVVSASKLSITATA